MHDFERISAGATHLDRVTKEGHEIARIPSGEAKTLIGPSFVLLSQTLTQSGRHAEHRVVMPGSETRAARTKGKLSPTSVCSRGPVEQEKETVAVQHVAARRVGPQG